VSDEAFEAVAASPGGPAEPVGQYTYHVGTDTWTWTDEVYEIHGRTPQQIAPSIQLLLDHKHPEDEGHAAEVIAKAQLDGEPFSCYHRIIDAHGDTRNVVVAGEGVLDEAGHVVELRGFFIDLTQDIADQAAETAKEAVVASAEHRAAIEQAKGALMITYGLDKRAAFALLRWWSMSRNIKLHELAERLMHAARSGIASDSETRHVVDVMLDDLSH